MKNFLLIMTSLLAMGALELNQNQPDTAVKQADNYQTSPLPTEIEKLWVSEGNVESDTVLIYCQGGPETHLFIEKDGKKSLH